MLNTFPRARNCTSLVLRTYCLDVISSTSPGFDWLRPRPEALSVGLNVREPLNCQGLSSLARPSRTSGDGRPHSSRSLSPHKTAMPIVVRPSSFNNRRRKAQGPRRPAVEAKAQTEAGRIVSETHRRRIQGVLQESKLVKDTSLAISSVLQIVTVKHQYVCMFAWNF